MKDPALINQLEAEMREGRIDPDSTRPSLLHFDPIASGFLNLTNQIIALRAERSGNGKLNMAKGPEFPIEVVEQRLRAHASRKRADAIERAQAKFRERHPEQSAKPSTPRRDFLPPVHDPFRQPAVTHA
jgi:hypothetical protein